MALVLAIELLKSFKCDGCKEVLIPPAYHCSKSHVYCSRCHTPLCPRCSLPLMACEKANHLLENIILPCPNNPPCCQLLKLSSYSNHLCPEFNCPICLRVLDDQQHLTDHLLDHNPRTISCERPVTSLHVKRGVTHLFIEEADSEGEADSVRFMTLLLSDKGIIVNNLWFNSPRKLAIQDIFSGNCFVGLTSESPTLLLTNATSVDIDLELLGEGGVANPGLALIPFSRGALDCYICMNLICAPVDHCEANHVCCPTCVLNIARYDSGVNRNLRTNFCSYCSLPSSRCGLLSRLLSSCRGVCLDEYCSLLDEDGLSLGEFREHLEGCVGLLQYCPICGTSVSNFKRHLKTHPIMYFNPGESAVLLVVPGSCVVLANLSTRRHFFLIADGNKCHIRHLSGEASAEYLINYAPVPPERLPPSDTWSSWGFIGKTEPLEALLSDTPISQPASTLISPVDGSSPYTITFNFEPEIAPERC